MKNPGGGIGEEPPEYKAFIEKFKLKKTTDDCYTPEPVYNAVLEWVCREYDVDPKNVVRPFWPGGDYENFSYEKDCVVIDNPPFSILAKIVRFYLEREIHFFLFSPYLTNFNFGLACSHIIAHATLTYQNGAKVNTAFLTDMDEYAIRSVPDLQAAIKAADKEQRKKKHLPKYTYPPEVLTVAKVGYMCDRGIEVKIRKEDCKFIRGLDQQQKAKKNIFGGGMLISERAAAALSAYEDYAREKESTIVWELSDREREIVKSLG